MHRLSEICRYQPLQLESLLAFAKELTRRGFEIYKANRGNGRKGIGLKEPPEPMRQDPPFL
jgi:hypothetical protein